MLLRYSKRFSTFSRTNLIFKRLRGIHATRISGNSHSSLNYLLGRRHLQPGSADFGHAFEHLVIQEIIAYLGYHHVDGGLSYWHTYSDLEVDAVIGDALVAIEIKSCTEVQRRHLNGLKAFKEEHPDCRTLVVSLDERPRILQETEILPINDFLRMLWNDEIINPESIV